MLYSVTDYFKIIKYAIQNKKTYEFLRLKYRITTEKSKRTRQQEYAQQQISLKDALLRIFPDKNIDWDILSELENHIDDFKRRKKDGHYPSTENPYPIDFGLDPSFCRFLFSLCRFHEPEIVIETGIANGFSSSYILFSLDLAKKGKLISIDNLILPWHSKEKIGQSIPEWLKKRWTLIVGDAATELKKILKSHNSIDIFIHDSEHTYENMIKEFRLAWPHIKEKGFLLSDDVFRHDAFLNFADEVGRTHIIVKGQKEGVNFGVIQK